MKSAKLGTGTIARFLLSRAPLPPDETTPSLATCSMWTDGSLLSLQRNAKMFDRPVFRSCFHVEIVDGVGVVLTAERLYRVLRGAAVEAIAPLLDGVRTVADIVACLDEQVSAEQVHYTLETLVKQGILVEQSAIISEQQAAFWDNLDLEGTPVRAAPETPATVTLTALGNVSEHAFVEVLRTVGITPRREGTLEVVLTDSYLRGDLEAVNRQALETGRPYLLIKPTGTIVWVGPLFMPGRTGCWACLSHRLRLNLPIEHVVRTQQDGAMRGSDASLATTCTLALNIAATEVAKYVRWGRNPPLESTLVTFDTLSVATQHHAVVRLPFCPACGQAHAPRRPAPVTLASRTSYAFIEGGYRTVPPHETLTRFGHHVSPYTGAVRQVAPLSEASTGPVNTYVATYTWAVNIKDWSFLRRQTREQKSIGKGKSAVQARASALCEALERLSGVYRGDEAVEHATYQRMGSKAIHPNRCLHFSEAQYQHRDTTNGLPATSWIPHRFREDDPIAWTPLWSLTDATFKYLPTAYCYYHFGGAGAAYCTADSNGNAAGNTREEAILQGFMELVERDGVALWWYNRVRRPAVDLDSVGAPYIQTLRRYYARIERSFWVLDLTTDLGIPIFAAISGSDISPREPLLYGFGAHFDARIALERSLTEMNQGLPVILKMRQRTGFARTNSGSMDTWPTAQLAEHPYLLPGPQAPPETANSYPARPYDDLQEALEACIQTAQAKGMELLVLDQTRPDLGLPVVKVVVPGLRPHWRRLAPGRLYDVPVALGWRAAPLDEASMNPKPIVI